LFLVKKWKNWIGHEVRIYFLFVGVDPSVFCIKKPKYRGATKPFIVQIVETSIFSTIKSSDMYRIKTLVPFLFFLLSVLTTTAQANFVAGAIVKLNGDTIKGEIDYQQWAYNPKTIRFRANASESGKSYTYKDIKGFSIKDNDERYQTAILNVNNEAIDIKKMVVYESLDSIYTDFKLDLDTVFLLTLVQGRINLFELTYATDGKIHYFLQKDNSKLDELMYRQVKIRNRDTSGIYTVDTYKSQLRIITTDCLSEVRDFAKTPFVKSEIIQIITKFNVCSGKLSYKVKEASGEKYFSVITGVARPIVSARDYWSPNGISSYGQILPTIGASYEQTYNRMRNRLGFGIDLNLTFYKNYFNTKDIIYNRIIDYKVNTMALNLNVFLRYSLTAGKIQPYIKGGLGFSYLTSSAIELFGTDIGSTVQESIVSYNISPLQLRYLMAIGLKIGRFYTEPRVEKTLDLLDYGPKGVSSQLSLLCGYSWILNKKTRKK
jgi:hypothetical protein